MAKLYPTFEPGVNSRPVLLPLPDLGGMTQAQQIAFAELARQVAINSGISLDHVYGAAMIYPADISGGSEYFTAETGKVQNFQNISISSPESYYAMDEATGETDIGEAGGYALDLVGTVGTVAAKNGNGRDFPGLYTSYLTNANLGNLAGGNQDWSISCWFSNDSAGVDQMLMESRSAVGGAYAWDCEIVAGPAMGFMSAVSTVTLSASTLYHLAFGYSATEDEFWISVNHETPVTAADSDGTPSYRLYIGRDPGFNGHARAWDGAIDEISIFARDIRGDDHENIFNGGAGRFWDGSQWSDLSAAARNAIIEHDSVTAQAGEPSSASAVLQLTAPDGGLIFSGGSENFTAEISRDGGTTFAAATLTQIAQLGNIHTLRGVADLSGQPLGSEMKLKLATPGAAVKVIAEAPYLSWD